MRSRATASSQAKQSSEVTLDFYFSYCTPMQPKERACTRLKAMVMAQSTSHILIPDMIAETTALSATIA
jgi:hypothetical protein